jgi:hypothetical protein
MPLLGSTPASGAMVGALANHFFARAITFTV